MAGIVIPGLDRKLRLLIDYDHFTDWIDLGKAFGRAPSTVQWWGHGDNARKPNTIPAGRYARLLEIVATSLGEEALNERIKTLVFAPVAEFEAELRARDHVSLNKIIAAESVSNSGRLFLKPVVNTGLIETDRTPAPERNLPTVARDVWFRIEFSATNKTGHVLALQHVGKSWGLVSTHFDKPESTIHLPGQRDQQTLAYMRERLSVGLHRFIVIHTPKRPPAELADLLAEQLALDAPNLERIAHFYNEQPLAQRRIFLLTLLIEDRPQHMS